MSSIRLNPAAVAVTSDGPGPCRDAFDELAEAFQERWCLTRRDVVKAAGVAATVATGALSSWSLRPIAPAETGASARAAWLRVGGSRAVIDPALFGGHPTLAVSQNGSWLAELTGARFPGIALPAGMRLEVVGSGAASQLSITHELGGFRASVGLSDWLTGNASAASEVDLAGMSVDMGDGVVLEFGGRALATLHPDWSLVIEGARVASLVGLGADVVADAVRIALAGEAATSLFSRRIARRTVVTLSSREGVALAAPAADFRGELDLSGCSFGSLTLEAAETASGSAYRALMAHAASGLASYLPKAKGPAGPVPVEDVRFATLLDGSGSFHIAGVFPKEPVWVEQAGRAVSLGGAEWAPPFEVWGAGGKASVSARPALKAVALPFEGGISSPITLPADARVVLNMGDRKRGLAAGLATGIKGTGFGDLLETPFESSAIVLPTADVEHVVRPSDMLSLRFEFYNMTLDTASTPARFMPNPTTGGVVAVRFPSQHILEQAIIDSVWQVLSNLKPPLKAYLSGESTLAFNVTGTRVTSGIEYSMTGLLNWTGFQHRTVYAAEKRIYPDTPVNLTDAMRAPERGNWIGESAPETYIEMPWGLYLSPYSAERWGHRTDAFTKSGRTELWHTKLRGEYVEGAGGVFAADTSGTAASGQSYWIDPTVRAVWARHYQMHLDAAPNEVVLDQNIIQGVLNKKILTDGMFRNSFTTDGNEIGGFLNRWNVVDLSARFHGEAIKVNNLMLSSLGGWLDSIGEWDIDELKYQPPNGTYAFPIPGSLCAWEHRATMGRDQYVKLTTMGYLFPFGHRAVELTITERRVDTNTTMAFLGQKKFIVVLEPVKQYEQTGSFLQRRFPFKSVAIKTKRTPALKIDWEKVSGLTTTTNAYWVYTDVPAGRFMWQLEATDWDGVTHKFEMPLIWVKESTAKKGASTPSPSPATTLAACSNAMKSYSAVLGGKRIAFAEPTSGGNSRIMPTNNIKFMATYAGDGEMVEPSILGDIRFHPLMYQANVSLEAIEELTNQSAGTWIRIADIYRYNGFGGTNATGKVIAALASTKVVAFPGELSGGVATPIPRITGISATKGTFGGDETTFGGGEFNPMDIFDAVNAELFGGVTLVDLIKVAAGGLSLDKMPVFEKLVDNIGKKVTIKYEFVIPITNDVLIFVPDPGCTLTLRATVTTALDVGGPPPSYEVTGMIGPFQLQLLPPGMEFDALRVKFGLFTFTSVDGATPTVNPDIIDVGFGKDLAYLETLAEYLGGLSGASSVTALAKAQGKAPNELDAKSLAAASFDAGPLKIDVTGAGIKASLSIAIPDIAIGVFSLKNMSVSLGLTIPFNGNVVTLDFGFCSREAPFEILVMIYGGGGYVLMTFDPAGMRALEIGLEFGAGCAFGIGGVASGHVEVKGGLSIRYERLEDGEHMTFRCYIRIQGSLSILGLISITLTFYLDLTYKTFPKQSDPALTGDELTGTATLTIEIEILFFTIPVELSVTKTLAGDDPRFSDMWETQSEWDEYCDAFAPATLGA